MKKAIPALIAAVALLAPAGASAHVDISPTEAPAGKKKSFSFSVGHGCGTAATTGLVVEVPRQVGEYSVGSIPGWKSSGKPAGRMSWKGGRLPDGAPLEFPFRATVYGKKGAAVAFKVIQRCEGGLETAWISIGDDGGEGHGSPAPLLTLTSTASKPEPEPAEVEQREPSPEEQAATSRDDEETLSAAPASADSDQDGGPGVGVFVGIVLIAASVTAFIVIRRGRRSGDH